MKAVQPTREAPSPQKRPSSTLKQYNTFIHFQLFCWPLLPIWIRSDNTDFSCSIFWTLCTNSWWGHLETWLQPFKEPNPWTSSEFLSTISLPYPHVRQDFEFSTCEPLSSKCFDILTTLTTSVADQDLDVFTFWASWIRNLLSSSKISMVRKTLIPTVLWLLFDFLSLKNDVTVHSKSNKQKSF